MPAESKWTTEAFVLINNMKVEAEIFMFDNKQWPFARDL